MKHVAFKICFLYLIMGCAPTLHSKDIPTEADRQRLKDYAFCACLGSCSADFDPLVIKDGSSAGYFELSQLGESVFRSIDSLASLEGKKKIKSKENRPLCLMKCLRFYNSRLLDSALNSTIRSP